MGLLEQIQNYKSVFKRAEVSLSNSVYPTGSTTAFGATSILLGISADAPCRVRLYANSSSILIDTPRPSSSLDYSASVALSLDSGLTAGTLSLTFNPPVIITTEQDSKTWYNIEGAGTVNTTLRYYPIEYVTTDRQWINIPNASGVNLGANATSSGNFSGSLVQVLPKSFIMLQAYSDDEDLRLRLYSQPIENVPSSEKVRQFDTQSADDSYLISDMLFESASYLYSISPVLQAYNLEDYIYANNRIGYILENTSASPKTNVVTAVRIYSLEN